jgi:hypothetical protein
MNYSYQGCVSRGVVTAAITLIAMICITGNYHDIGVQDQLGIAAIIAVGVYGLLPVRLANWVFSLMCLALVGTLTIMFPVHILALIVVFGALFAVMGAMT